MVELCNNSNDQKWYLDELKAFYDEGVDPTPTPSPGAELRNVR
jgi:hypothetical protein